MNMKKEKTQYLTFTIEQEQYALGVGSVVEVIEFGTFTRVPKMPSALTGVMNIRGTITPILDLKKYFSLGPSRISESTRVIVTEIQWNDEHLSVGIITEGVDQVIDILPDQIESIDKLNNKQHFVGIEALGKVNEQFIILLDMTKLLANFFENQ